jgi:Cu-processing system permease protein
LNAVSIIAMKEIRDGIRNRWVIGSILLLTVLAVSLLLLGSAPAGSVKADALEVTVVSLSSLTVYLLPLIALTLSFDAFIGEFERGTMLLLLTYPVRRWQIIAGKFIGHLAILSAAVLIGYGLTGVVIGYTAESGSSAILAYIAMMGSSLLLGAVFIGLGYLVSVLVREWATAVACAIGMWLVFVVLYDLMLLGIVVADESHHLNQQLFSLMLLASPTDVYRILNLTGTDALITITGMADVAATMGLNKSALLMIMAGWVVVPVTLVGVLFNRREL